jgi:hypothetical protein
MKIKIPYLPISVSINREFPNTFQSMGEQDGLSNTKDKNYPKIFCIGSNKTGTTSIEKLLSQFGFKLGNQPTAEVLSRDWLHHKDASRIIRYCHTADAFQDVPFGFPDIYKILDEHFPNSKFILTVRNSADEWFESLVRFHTKLFSSDPNRPPNEEDLKNALYRYQGYIHEGYFAKYGQFGIPPYDPSFYKASYLELNEEKRNYFKSRPNDFLEINLSKHEDFKCLCQFLNVRTNIKSFPHENQTKWINSR